MIPVFLCASLLLSSVAHARVTFSYSEVLQASDLTETNQNRAAFKCGNGCRAYTDLHSNNMYITEWDGTYYKTITNFNDIGPSASGEVVPLPEPYVLKPSKNYYIENRGDKNPQFVFYVVDVNSPNQLPVMILTGDTGNQLNGGTRMVTTLSSKYESVRYTKFEGTFTDGYPRIYSMGFDAVAELQCSPVYKARSQESAEKTSVSVFSPISTVDYGNESGKNSVSVNWNANGQISQDAKGSTVYMSPGYVGCSYKADQSYSSTSNSVQDSFKINAVSLDVNALLHLSTAEDALHLTINDDNFGEFGTPTFTKHYDADNYNVFVKWNRKLSNANFALQLDFGLGKTGWTSSRPISTTSSSSMITIFVPMIALIGFLL